MQVDTRHDWTPSEKLEFEDIAIQFITTVPVKYQNRSGFIGWLQKYHPDFMSNANIVWSYVLAN